MSAPNAVVSTTQPAAGPLPSPQSLVNAAKLSIEQDKPIQLDYYVDTFNKKAFLGQDDKSGERMLVKSGEEFTSLIKNVYKVTDDYIVVTENSIYIVSGKIERRMISSPGSHS
jgi:hypothetical protein